MKKFFLQPVSSSLGFALILVFVFLALSVIFREYFSPPPQLTLDNQAALEQKAP